MFPTFAVGGAQARMAAVANRLGPAFRHAVLALDGDIACRERLSPALDVAFPQVETRKGDLAGNLRRYRAMLAALRPHRLVTHNWGSIEWAMANLLRPGPGFSRLPHIHIEDGFGPEERDRQIPRRVLMRRLVLRGSRVVLPSQVLCRIAAEEWRLPPGGVTYIPNGVDLRRFAVDRPDRAVPVIGTVAAFRPEKNLPRLLRAFAGVAAPCRLVLVGDGAGRPALEALAGASGIADRVTFLGHRSDPAGCYGDFDIFALSSDTEQMPLTVLEAMAAGLPVAATDVGDIAAMVAAENRGCITAPDDAALGAALQALAADPVLRRRVGAANRARAEEVFDQEAMFDAYRALFSGALPDISRSR